MEAAPPTGADADAAPFDPLARKRKHLALPSIARRKAKEDGTAAKPRPAAVKHLVWIAPVSLALLGGAWFTLAPEPVAEHSQVVVQGWTKDAMLLVAAYPSLDAAATDLAKKLADATGAADKRGIAEAQERLGLLAALQGDRAAAARAWTEAAKLHGESDGAAEAGRIKVWLNEITPPDGGR